MSEMTPQEFENDLRKTLSQVGPPKVTSSMIRFDTQRWGNGAAERSHVSPRKRGWQYSLGVVVLLLGAVAIGPWSQRIGVKTPATQGGTPVVRSPRILAGALPPFDALAMGSLAQGYAVSGHNILMTSDGGAYWRKITPSGIKASPRTGITNHRPWVVSQDLGTASIQFQILEPSGTRWTVGSLKTSLLRPGAPLIVRSVDFINAQRGWMVLQPQHGMNGEPGNLYTTSNGGVSWHKINTTTGGWVGAGPLRFLNAATGWAVGSLATTSPNLLMVTHDGGRHFVRATVPGGSATLQNVLMPPKFFGSNGILPIQILSPGGGSSQLVLDATRNAGQTFTAMTPIPSGTGPFSPLIDMVSKRVVMIWQDRVISMGVAVASFGGRFELTQNSGKTWVKIPTTGTLHTMLRRGFVVKAIDFLNAQQGWVSLGGPLGQGVLFKTTNGGKSWAIDHG